MSDFWIPLWLSLKVAGWATLINLIAGVAAGYLLARVRFPGKELLDTTLTLPLVLPPTILGYYLLVVVGKKGWLGSWLDSLGIHLIFSWQGAVMAASLVAFPLVFKAARTAFETIDPQFEEAANVLGLGKWQTFCRVSLPLAWRGILAGTLLSFARAMGEFGATLMVAGSIPGKTQTLSIAVYEAVQAGEDHLANQLVMITSLSCMLVLWGANRLLPGHHARQLPRA